MLYGGNRVIKAVDMNNLSREEKYSQYIQEHIFNVENAFKHNLDIFKEFFSEEDIEQASKNIMIHDALKFSPEEFDGYMNKFYPKNGVMPTEMDNRAYDLAWMHHYSHHMHHPESWIIMDHNPKSSGPTMRVLEMDNPYLIEMICDWQSFKYTGKGDAYEFYHNVDRKEGLLGEATRIKLELVLAAIHNKNKF